jgi:hypothetical protein
MADDLVEVFKRLGMSEKTAERAADGRDGGAARRDIEEAKRRLAVAEKVERLVESGLTEYRAKREVLVESYLARGLSSSDAARRAESVLGPEPPTIDAKRLAEAITPAIDKVLGRRRGTKPIREVGR